MSEITTKSIILALEANQYGVTLNGITGTLHCKEVQGQKYFIFATNEEEVYGIDTTGDAQFAMKKLSKKGRMFEDKYDYSSIELKKSIWENWMGIA